MAIPELSALAIPEAVRMFDSMLSIAWFTELFGGAGRG